MGNGVYYVTATATSQFADNEQYIKSGDTFTLMGGSVGLYNDNYTEICKIKIK
jgi:hypothetical protein